MIVYINNPKNSTGGTPTLENTFNIVARSKKQNHKNQYPSYILMPNGLTPFTIASNNM